MSMRTQIYILFFLFLLFLSASCVKGTSGAQKNAILGNEAKTANLKGKQSMIIDYRSIDEIHQLEVESIFGNYLVTDAVWVNGHPLLVNQEFDFAIGIALPDIGLGIAAKKRKDANNDTARKLESMSPISLADEFDKAVQSCQSNYSGISDFRASILGLLFGEKKARLQMVLEIVQKKKKDKKDNLQLEGPMRFIYVSQELPLNGEQSWIENNGVVLAQAMKNGSKKLAEMFCELSQPIVDQTIPDLPVSNQIWTCPLGDMQKAEGKFVKELNGRAILQLEKNTRTLLSCDKETIKEKSQ